MVPSFREILYETEEATNDISKSNSNPGLVQQQVLSSLGTTTSSHMFPLDYLWSTTDSIETMNAPRLSNPSPINHFPGSNSNSGNKIDAVNNHTSCSFSAAADARLSSTNNNNVYG